MDVYINGKKTSLSSNTFKGQGGEGAVYIKGTTAYKIYTDPKKMIPLGKIQELSSLTLPRIIRPQDVLRDDKGNPIGYTMTAVPDSYVLCQTFPKSFRDRNNYGTDAVIKLVQKMREGIEHIHSHKNLIVDLNEMNFLVEKNFDAVYFIDVDSYQTPNYKATAIMDSSRDRHAKQFDNGTDWFSFGITACQMLVGIHPYKGKHTTLKTLEERMQKNISIFHKDVNVPAATLPFDVIPQAYRDWFEAIFDKGQRVAPPDSLAGGVLIVTPRISRTAGSNNYEITLMNTYAGDVVYFFENSIVTTEGVYGHRQMDYPTTAVPKIGVTPKSRDVIAASLKRHQLSLHNVSKRRDIVSDIEAEDVMSYNGRIYIKQGESIFELEMLELPNSLIVKPQVVGNVLEKSTQLFEGVAMQNLLGAHYASIFAESRTNHQVHLKELVGYRIIDAKFDTRVLVVLAEKAGQMDRFIYKFDSSFSQSDLRITPNVSYYDLNFIVLDNGICLMMGDNDELEIFSSQRGSTSCKVIADPALTGDCTLFKYGKNAMFAKGNQMFSIKMK